MLPSSKKTLLSSFLFSNSLFKYFNNRPYSFSHIFTKSKSKRFLSSGLVLTTSVGLSFALLSKIRLDLSEPEISTFSASSGFVNYRSLFLNEDKSISLKDKSLFDLFRSLFVFEICQYSFVVENTNALISLAKSLYLSSPMFWFIRKTFFNQFCGGETAEELIPRMQSLKNSGIGSILDLSVEADLTDEDSQNDKADCVMNLIEKCIQTASSLPGNFVAVKVTALGSTKSMEKSSALLSYLYDLFSEIDKDNDGAINFEEFSDFVSLLPGVYSKTTYISKELIKETFTKLDKDKKGRILFSDIKSFINLEDINQQRLFTGKIPLLQSQSKKFSHSQKYCPFVSVDDLNEISKIQKRLDQLCQTALKLNVKLMIDAEQTYFQPTIDYVALNMMRKYNQNETLIYNTYQMYLKDGLQKLICDLEISRKEKFYFGSKIVRGAYLISERKRADVLEIKNPIQESIENTHKDYNRAIELLLDKAVQSKIETNRYLISFMVASHNRESVILSCEKMQELGIHPQSGVVYFGQLLGNILFFILGMHDHLSYVLAHHGFMISKYIPYGSVEEVIPYLIRRAQENKSVLVQGKDEFNDRLFIWEEIKRRIIGGRGVGKMGTIKA